MKKQIVDIVYGAAAVVFSLFCFAYLIPAQIRGRKAYVAEASVFPKLAVAVIGFAGLALVVSRLYHLADKRALLDRANYLLNGKALLRQAVFIAIMVAYIHLIPSLGFVIATVLFLLVMLYYFGSRAVVKNAVVAVAFSVIVYLLFSRLFQVNLASGLLPF